MAFRLREVLLVSSLYDSFILQEDGQVTEPILSEFIDLDIRYAPRMTRVSTGQDALDSLASDRPFDLVIVTTQLGNISPVEFAEEVKNRYLIPVVLLGYDGRAMEKLLAAHPDHQFDHVFVWNGDAKVFMAIIKLVEDRLNVLPDTQNVGVQVILLIEDSIHFLSVFLPILYTELFLQQKRVIAEGINLPHKILRTRARPKVLHAADFESAWKLLEKHGDHLLGVISDIRFPREGELDSEAGIRFLEKARETRQELPFLLQSSGPGNQERAEKAGAAFLDKNSHHLHHEVRKFMLDNFGFGPFVFRSPQGRRITCAETMRELEEKLKIVPEDSLRFHAERNHFSTWLRARTAFRLASKLQPKAVSAFADIEAIRSYLVETVHEFRKQTNRGVIADFDRESYDATNNFARIGGGSLGGKARGLAFLDYLLSHYQPGEQFENVRVTIPSTVVLDTDMFDLFMEENDLEEIALGDAPDHAIRGRFLAARLPEELVEDLRAVIRVLEGPLAVRSSSLLEDSPYQPFAGIYHTYMVPNLSPDLEERLEDLLQAVKLVYASTFFSGAKTYLRATPYHQEEEKMGVVIQKLVGRRHGNRFYPSFSGIARSHNYYPHGPMNPEDGVAYVALGLGKAVAEGYTGVRFCPLHPRHLPQFSTVEDTLANSQKEFFALQLDSQAAEPWKRFRPVQFPVAEADRDGVLGPIGSVYSHENHVVSDGTSRPGTRLVTFAGILKHDQFPLAPLMNMLLESGQWGMGAPVEMEFSVDLEPPPGREREFTLLQIRPLVLAGEEVQVDLGSLEPGRVLLSSKRALGNGRITDIQDVLFIDPARFDRSRSLATAAEVDRWNAVLLREERPYLLIGPGRWGSSDPYLGIPVNWGQISGARVVVETGFKDFRVEPSEGTHFFHNMTSFGVGYMTVNPELGEGSLDWDWLRSLKPDKTDDNGLSWVRLSRPLKVLIDGRNCSGSVLKPDPGTGLEAGA